MSVLGALALFVMLVILLTLMIIGCIALYAALVLGSKADREIEKLIKKETHNE